MILRSIRKKLIASTLLVVSHRQSTLCGFARVLNLSHGQIVHDSDYKSNPVARDHSGVDVLQQTDLG